jgi:hypothetical protein
MKIIGNSRDVLHNLVQAKIGYITKIKQQHEYLQKDKRLYVDIKVGATLYKHVPFASGGIDLTTKNPHGMFILPRKDQCVAVWFINGNHGSPMACTFLPFEQYKKDQEKYYNIVKDKDNNATIDEIQICHYKGQSICFRNDGSIDIRSNLGSSGGTQYFLNISFDNNGNITVKDKNPTPNQIKLSSTGIDITDNTNVPNEIKMSSTGIDLTATTGQTVNVNGNTHPAIFGDDLVTAFQTFCNVWSSMPVGTSSQNSAVLGAMQGACAALLVSLNLAKSNKVKLG